MAELTELTLHTKISTTTYCGRDRSWTTRFGVRCWQRKASNPRRLTKVGSKSPQIAAEFAKIFRQNFLYIFTLVSIYPLRAKDISY